MTNRSLKALSALLAPVALAACATPGQHSGALTSYDGLEADNGLRAAVTQRRDDDKLAKIERVFLAPAAMVDNPQTEWLEPEEEALLLREVDAQVCFEVTERYARALSPEDADATVRTFVTRAEPTGRVASTLSVAAGFFIPGPLGLRVPGETGGLGAEAELLSPKGRQLAALVWNRDVTAIGTDDPSLSRLGDALQFAEPFGDAVGEAVAAKDAESREIEDPDPCAEYGPRFRPEGWLAKFVTGFYVPSMSGARQDEAGEDTAER